MRSTIILMVIAIIFVSGCAERNLKLALEEANYCEAKEDCVLIGSKCPFDCYIYVHKSNADDLKSRVDSFKSLCAYSCIATKGVECRENKCIVIPE